LCAAHNIKAVAAFFSGSYCVCILFCSSVIFKYYACVKLEKQKTKRSHAMLKKHTPKLVQGIIAILAATFLLSSCATYVDNGPDRRWVPAHRDRMGYWIPGHAVGGGTNWANGHYNRGGAWVPGHWR
jgi:hypothetical protein